MTVTAKLTKTWGFFRVKQTVDQEKEFAKKAL
jgi:hypothetical protein